MPARKPVRWNLKKELRELKTWVKGNSERVEPSNRKFLESALRERSTNLDRVLIGLEDLSLARANQGALAVLEGNASGWGDILVGARYELYCRYVAVLLYDQKRAEGGEVNEEEMEQLSLSVTIINFIMLSLATAIALGDDKLADWFGARLIRSAMEQDGLVDNLAWSLHRFDPWMLRLYALWRGLDLDLKKMKVKSLGPYARVLKGWKSENAFAQALPEIYDYHCAQIRDDEDDFSWPPYSVFPGEILALFRIRRELGLSVPTIEHPLLDSPLANPPTLTAKEMQDKTLDRVVRVCCKVSPSFAPPG